MSAVPQSDAKLEPWHLSRRMTAVVAVNPATTRYDGCAVLLLNHPGPRLRLSAGISSSPTGANEQPYPRTPTPVGPSATKLPPLYPAASAVRLPR